MKPTDINNTDNLAIQKEKKSWITPEIVLVLSSDVEGGNGGGSDATASHS